MTGNKSLTRLFMELRGRLARDVLGIVPPKEVEDIIQETYVRACQANDQEQIRQPKAYLYKVARNLALDYVNKAETRLAVSQEDLADGVEVSGSLLRDTTMKSVVSDADFATFCEAVRRLPKQQRRAFVLKKVYGYKQKEIAQIMQLSEKTVERHIALGMERCMEYLEVRGLSVNENRRNRDVMRRRK